MYLCTIKTCNERKIMTDVNLCRPNNLTALFYREHTRIIYHNKPINISLLFISS